MNRPLSSAHFLKQAPFASFKQPFRRASCRISALRGLGIPALLALLTLLLFPAEQGAYAQQDQDLLAACLPAAALADLPPLPARVRAAPPNVIAYLTQENQKDGIPLVPAPVRPAPVFRAALQSILTNLSQPLRKVLAEHLAGIYIVRDLGSSGFTEEFLSKDNKRFAFVALDADVLLRRPANQWSSWKENSAFLPSPGAKLAMAIESGGSDSVENAVRFILLHELGHVFGYICGAHPGLADIASGTFQDYPFVGLSWQKQGGRIQSRFDAFFPERGQLRFYGAQPKLLQLADAPALYNKVAKTNFPSLYGSLSIHEDFAESFAIYVHAVRSGRPWRVEATAPGKGTSTLNSCFTDGRCPGKKRFFDKFFQNP